MTKTKRPFVGFNPTDAQLTWLRAAADSLGGPRSVAGVVRALIDDAMERGMTFGRVLPAQRGRGV